MSKTDQSMFRDVNFIDEDFETERLAVRQNTDIPVKSDHARWFITVDGCKLFKPAGRKLYTEVTLSNDRINQIVMDAILEFNKQNPVKKTA